MRTLVFGPVPDPPSNVALAILIGGRGLRMGGVLKPALRRPDGKTLLENVVALLGASFCSVYVVAPKDILDRLSDVLERLSVTWVVDRGEGPARALIEVAKQTGASRLLLVAGDHPNPSLALAKRLEEAMCSDPGAEAIVVLHRARLQPLFALYSVDAVEALSSAPRSMMKLLELLDPVVLDSNLLSSEERDALEDVDTPDDAVRFQLKA